MSRLLAPQRFDRIESRGPHGRIQPEEQSDDGGDADPHGDRPDLTAAGRGVSFADEERQAEPEEDADDPAQVESVTDSVRICQMMSRRRAPSALRRPISRVRSLTTISMMFMMTMPPTTSERATTPTSTAKMPAVACR